MIVRLITMATMGNDDEDDCDDDGDEDDRDTFEGQWAVWYDVLPAQGTPTCLRGRAVTRNLSINKC